MAQAAHSSAPDIAGQNIANPVGIILSTVMLVDWLSIHHNDLDLKLLAERMEEALFKTIEEGIKIIDLKGNTSTTEFTVVTIAKL